MSLTIGKLAQSANVNVETIRYYQRVGLLKEPSKPMTGYREYPVAYVARIHFIKHAQQLGFTLKEIVKLLLLDDNHCADVRQFAEQKRAQIEIQSHKLNAMHDVLDHLIKACLKEHSTEHCSIIDALSDKHNKKS
jgi:MerR family mercuric resistance operon transcriptional regulator